MVEIVEPLSVSRRDGAFCLPAGGRLFLPGLFTGQHHFRIEDQGSSCRFHQSEHFSGILLAFLGTGMLHATRRGFEAMNSALKQRAEASLAVPSS